MKPLWGFFSDALPIFGSRRKSYLLISSACAGLVWLCLSLTENYTAANLLLLVTVSYFAYAVQDVVADGWMVEEGKPDNLTGRYQAIQWGAVYLAMTITAIWGGHVSDLARKGTITYQSIFGITAFFPLITLLVAAFLARETAGQPASNVAGEIKSVLTKRDIWILSAFLFFWNFSPSINVPFFFYAVDTLKFDGKFLGWVQAATSVAAFLGSFLYKRLERFPTRQVLVWAVFAGTGSALFTYIYFMPYIVTHPGAARAVTLASSCLFGMANILIFLTLVNLAAKICPQYGGGTTFAFLMSFYNLGSMGSAAAGGALLPIVGFKPLIAVSAACSLLTLIFIPYLSLEKGKAASRA